MFEEGDSLAGPQPAGGDAPQVFAHDTEASRPTAPMSLSHLTGVPTVFMYQDPETETVVVHIGFSNCQHNIEPIPGLAMFLRQATMAATSPVGPVSIVTIEICPELMEAFGEVANTHPEIGA
ncbi:hypothetical protein LCGC14_3091820, partial [marine sediment metagenome]